MKIKFNSTTALRVASTVIGVAGLLIGNMVAANEREALKEELKDELKDELSKEND